MSRVGADRATETTVAPTSTDPTSRSASTETPLPSAAGTTTPTAAPSAAACGLIAWTDLPAEVRSATSKPTPVSTEGPDNAACRLDNTVLGTITGTGPGYSESIPSMPTADFSHPEYFIVRVTIGSHVSVDPSNYPQAQEILVADYAGLVAPGRSEEGAPYCRVVYQGQTKTLVGVVNNRFPKFDPCDLAVSVAEAVASRQG